MPYPDIDDPLAPEMHEPLTPEMFKLAYPEFATLDDLPIQQLLDEFEMLHGLQYCGAEKLLQGLYVAHRLSIRGYLATPMGSATSGEEGTTHGVCGAGGLYGNLKSKKEGDVTVVYNTNAPAVTDKAGDYWKTAYGTQFENLFHKFSTSGLVSQNCGC